MTVNISWLVTNFPEVFEENIAEWYTYRNSHNQQGVGSHGTGGLTKVRQQDSCSTCLVVGGCNHCQKPVDTPTCITSGLILWTINWYIKDCPFKWDI